MNKEDLFAESCYESGQNYYYGNDCKEDYSAAAEQFLKAAKLGHAGAIYMLGCMYRFGEYFNKDRIQALMYFCSAKAKGYSRTSIFSSTDDVMMSIEVCLELEAADWKTQKMTDGSPIVVSYADIKTLTPYEMFQIGAVYHHGYRNLFEPNLELAVYWWKKAAKNGFSLGEKLVKVFGNDRSYISEAALDSSIAEIYYELGKNYYYGYDGNKDYGAAATQFQIAADLGHAGAMFELGCMYEYGDYFNEGRIQALIYFCSAKLNGYIHTLFGSSNDLMMLRIRACLEKETYKWLEPKRADGTDEILRYPPAIDRLTPYEMFQMGAMYMHGGYFEYSKEPNLKSAFFWWKKAVDHGFLLAEQLIEVFKTENPDDYTAFLSEAKADKVNTGNNTAESYYESGENYYYGYDGKEDYRAAAEQFLKAADLGHAGAMYMLGCMYRYGFYFKEDNIQALTYYCSAKMKGYSRTRISSSPDDVMMRILVCLEDEANEWRERKMTEGCPTVVSYTDMKSLTPHEMFQIGAVYHHGYRGLLEPDMELAVYWWKKAAENGFLLANQLIEIFQKENKSSPDYKSDNSVPATNKQHSESPAHNAAVDEEAKIMESLNELVGLSSIKADVSNLISLVKMQKIRASKGLKSVPVSKHLVFAGNPGTGKTTVARILAQLYKEIGVLKQGQLIEVSRPDLVGGYVGQTAIKTQEKINEAMGGVLFIDEAYTLVKEGNDYGQEAIDTILKAMEDHRDEFVVIAAGYTNLMQKFINSNPGLKSRFSKFFVFEDYTAEELTAIFDTLCDQYDYTITEAAHNAVSEKICEMERNKGSNFANARDVRNYFEKIITRQATRISFNSSLSDDEITLITIEDV